MVFASLDFILYTFNTKCSDLYKVIRRRILLFIIHYLLPPDFPKYIYLLLLSYINHFSNMGVSTKTNPVCENNFR